MRGAGDGTVSELVIAAPLRLEQAMIRAGVRRARGLGASVHHTGMGPGRARAAVATLSAHPARALLVMGFCGGLDDRGDVGDAVVAESVQGPEGELVQCAGGEALAEALRRGGIRVRRGVVASVPRLAMGETRTRLREAGAIAVDMESIWLAPAAGGRPFAVLRIVSDTPSRELTRPLATVAGIARASAALARAARCLNDDRLVWG